MQLLISYILLSFSTARSYRLRTSGRSPKLSARKPEWLSGGAWCRVCGRQPSEFPNWQRFLNRFSFSLPFRSVYRLQGHWSARCSASAESDQPLSCYGLVYLTCLCFYHQILSTIILRIIVNLRIEFKISKASFQIPLGKRYSKEYILQTLATNSSQIFTPLQV